MGVGAQGGSEPIACMPRLETSKQVTETGRARNRHVREGGTLNSHTLPITAGPCQAGVAHYFHTPILLIISAGYHWLTGTKTYLWPWWNLTRIQESGRDTQGTGGRGLGSR